HHRSGRQCRLAAERRRGGGVRILHSGSRLAAGTCRRLPRLSGDPGTVAGVRRHRGGDQSSRRFELHGDRPPCPSALGPRSVAMQISGIAVRAELEKWPLSLRIGSTILMLIVLAGVFAPLLTP